MLTSTSVLSINSVPKTDLQPPTLMPSAVNAANTNPMRNPVSTFLSNQLKNLVNLQQQHPWPDSCPDVPEDWHGWLCKDTAATLSKALSMFSSVVNPIIIECGSWLGLSTQRILEFLPTATVICLDTWEGSPEHQPEKDKLPDGTPGLWAQRLPTLQDTFYKNLWGYRERVIPVVGDSIAGLHKVAHYGVKPQLVYLDSLHTYNHVITELAACRQYWPNVSIVCDDCYLVGNAVRDFAKREYLENQLEINPQTAAYFPHLCVQQSIIPKVC